MAAFAQTSEHAPTSEGALGGQSPLSGLLDQEYYLVKILPYLIEDGLHESRRVCRKWKDICDQLPVHLGRIDIMEIRAAATVFPHATSLRCPVETKYSGAHFTEHLGNFDQLKHLTLVYTRDRIEPSSNVDPIPVDRQIFPQPIQTLVSLDVRKMPTKWSRCFYAFLRGLTNLTSLKLESFRLEDAPQQPFGELQNLNELSVGLQFLADRDGNLLFPMLPKLTTLSVKIDPNPFRQGDIRVLEVNRLISLDLLLTCSAVENNTIC